MVREGGKSKGVKKRKEKGGARTFVVSAEDMAHRDAIEQQRNQARRQRRDEDGSDEDDQDEDDEEYDSQDEDDDSGVTFERVQTKSLFEFSDKADSPPMPEEKKKKSGIASIIKIENPNLIAPQTKVMKAKDMSGDVVQTLSRREREAIEKERATAYYMKKHLAGETDEAKRDLARLNEVKKRREEAELRKKEEEAAAAERAKNKNVVQDKGEDEPLDARAIKALKPAILKEKLKERNLSTQGQKKELIQRLIDYENERAL